MILSATQSDPAGTVLFWLFALMTAGSALLVVVSRNVVRMAVSLLFTLLGVGGLYFLLNAEFLAALQLVVYAGGTLILIIFGVMLTSKSPFSRYEAKTPEIVIAVSCALVLLTAILMALPVGPATEKLDASAAPTFLREGELPEALRSNVSYDADAGTIAARGRLTDAERRELVRLGEAELGVEGGAAYREAVDKLAAGTKRLFPSRPLEIGTAYPVGTLGTRLLGEYLLPFEIVSVLLLTVMIGSAYLAKARRREASEAADASVASSRQARQWS